MVNQLSVFVENRSGAIMEVTQILSDAGINLRAMSIADASDFGIARMIVDKPEAASALLNENGITSTLSSVIGVEIDDTPGAFHKIITSFYQAEVRIEYTYAFLSQSTGRAYAIVRVDNTEKALESLKKSGHHLLDSSELA